MHFYSVPFEYLDNAGKHELSFAYLFAGCEKTAEERLRKFIRLHHGQFINLADKIEQVDIDSWDNYVYKNWDMFSKELPDAKALHQKKNIEHIYLLPAIYLAD